MTKLSVILFMFCCCCSPKGDEIGANEKQAIVTSTATLDISPSDFLGKWEYRFSTNNGVKFIINDKFRSPDYLHYILLDTLEYKLLQTNIIHMIRKNKFSGIGVFQTHLMESKNIKFYPIISDKFEIIHWSESGVKELFVKVEKIQNDTLILSDNFADSYTNGIKTKFHYYTKTK